MSVPMLDGHRPLALIASLTDRLEDRGVSYCHWKSTTAIDRSATGDNDLDLLVARGDVLAFTEILSHLGFLRADVRRARAVPGTEDFYGFDRPSGRLVHVHAHYQLVLGNDRTKNYRLPVEDAYLSSAERRGVFRLPAPEFEFVVFVVRMGLKYAIWDEIAWNALRGGEAGPKRSEMAEFEDLRARVDPARVSAVLKSHFPFLGEGLFQECVDFLSTDLSLARRVRLARRLEGALRPHAGRAPSLDAWVRIWRRAELAFRRRVGRLPTHRPTGGGVMIGIMGGDGSGKSTALAEVSRWLEGEFDTRRIHLGKPRWSPTTVAVRGSLKLAAMGASVLRRSSGGVNMIERYRPLFWYACTARDRALTFRRARSFVAGGAIVMSDRYPHPSLQLMEAPQIERTAGDLADRPLVRYLAALEKRHHDSITPPELLAVLRVDPEVAVVRKVDEPPESVRRRGREIWETDWEGSSVHVIDASRSRADVVADLKSLIWSVLT